MNNHLPVEVCFLIFLKNKLSEKIDLKKSYSTYSDICWKNMKKLTLSTIFQWLI